MQSNQPEGMAVPGRCCRCSLLCHMGLTCHDMEGSYSESCSISTFVDWSMPRISHEGTHPVSCVLSMDCVGTSLRCTALLKGSKGITQSIPTDPLMCASLSRDCYRELLHAKQIILPLALIVVYPPCDISPRPFSCSRHRHPPPAQSQYMKV